MRKTLVLIATAAALTTWSVAQDQDNSAKQDMKNAGHHVAEAAKATGSGLKKGAVATKDKVTGRKDDADNDARRLPNRDDDRVADRDRDQKQNASRNSAAARDEAAERTVHITNGPNVNPSSHSATVSWDTNKTAATDVWLMGGGIRGHRTQYVRGGSRNHSVTFSNLKPNTTYTYEIRTREGGDRKQGSFTTR
jgi:hypothetical protein